MMTTSDGDVLALLCLIPQTRHVYRAKRTMCAMQDGHSIAIHATLAKVRM